MDEKRCEEIRKHIVQRVDKNESRLNNHTKRLDIVEREIVGMKKDTSRLEQILDKLEIAIENLNLSILELKYKPLKTYEKVAMIFFSAVIGYLVAMWFQ